MSKMVWWVGGVAMLTSAVIIVRPGVVSPQTYLLVLASAVVLFAAMMFRSMPPASFWLLLGPAVMFTAWIASQKVMRTGVVTSNITEVGALMLAVGIAAVLNESAPKPAVQNGPASQRRGDGGGR